MKYLELVNKYKVLNGIANLKLPRKASAAIARNMRGLKAELEVYEEQRSDIANRFAQKDENGNFIIDNSKYTFKDRATYDGFMAEMFELNEIDVPVDIVTFGVSELDKCDESGRYDIITAAQESSIAWMINYGDARENG